jgi:hypothetical protein
MNDAVKGFVSARKDVRLYMEFLRNAENPGLRVFTPTPEYVLAMKCMAMRTGGQDTPSDISDSLNLIGVTGIRSIQEILTLVEKYFPAKLVTPRTFFGIQEIGNGVVMDARLPSGTAGTVVCNRHPGTLAISIDGKSCRVQAPEPICFWKRLLLGVIPSIPSPNRFRSYQIVRTTRNRALFPIMTW